MATDIPVDPRVPQSLYRLIPCITSEICVKRDTGRRANFFQFILGGYYAASFFS
jgi:hypothetical protein